MTKNSAAFGDRLDDFVQDLERRLMEHILADIERRLREICGGTAGMILLAGALAWHGQDRRDRDDRL